METALQEQIAFYLTGRRPGRLPETEDQPELRPALMAAYRDLTQLRYDYPLVLVDGETAGIDAVQSLSAIMDGVLREIAQGDDAARLTRHTLRLEHAIRSAVAEGARGTLGTLWDQAAPALTPLESEPLRDSLQRARAALRVDGAVIDCGQETPELVLRHVWATVQRDKAARAQAEIDTLILRLSEILRVDFAHSAAGLSADRLRAAVPAPQADLFDFEAMSRLLRRSSAAAPLPERRRERIELVLDTLRSQRFFSSPTGAGVAAFDTQYSFVFYDCASALTAYRERMPQAVELAKAIAIAKLEIASEYSEATHDALFAEFGPERLDSQELARFPEYLVCLAGGELHGDELDTLLEMLSAGLPVKVLVRTDDLLGEPGRAGETHLAFGARARQLANMAIGLNEVYVLQASASQLYQLRERILAGLAGSGPALFSLFSGAGAESPDLPPYLIAAAAVEARAFPSFAYDPHAGDNWAERFQLEGNPQVELDWPVHSFSYEDEHHQRVETEVAFTPADFVACDRRYAGHVVPAPRASWDGSIVPLAEYLSQNVKGVPDRLPGIHMVDRENRLQQVIVDDKLIQATRRCRDAWHSWQELGGIHNSHAQRLLAHEREIWEAQASQAAAVQAPVLAPATDELPAPVAAASAPEAPSPEADDAPSRDLAYVETARCTSCNECVQINGKLFAYDENKQCHIVNLDAGSYRDLVEAAENCQVAIIHPGKPRNPNEPGLEELLARAEPFR